MPGRVLERAVYIRSELLHFCGEFFSLVCFRLVGWSAGHRCGAAAGVQLYRCARRLASSSLLLQVSGGSRCDTQYWSGLVCVASAIRAVV